jgi:hypothetical protein
MTHNLHTLKLKNRIKRVLGNILVIPSRYLLQRYGYYAKPIIGMFPKSHYYKSDTVFDFFKGLHNIPSNKAWLESKVNNVSIKRGQLIPWITYPALSFLDKLALTEKSVVEFGAGASTAYFVRRGAKITSFEFDTEYYFSVEPLVRNPNLKIIDVSKFELETDSEPINQSLIDLIQNDRMNASLTENFWNKFDLTAAIATFSRAIADADLVFVDGGTRSLAIGIAATKMKANAILIVDNSDANYIQKCFSILDSAGFVEIPFFGPGPLNPYEWGTSFFIKQLDSLK